MQAHATWSPPAETCLITGTNAFRWNILVNLIVDLTLLGIMFAGVLHKKNATRLWRMLYFQAIFWIMTAIATEVPCVVSHRHPDVVVFCVSYAFLKVLPFMNMNGMWKLMTRS